MLWLISSFLSGAFWLKVLDLLRLLFPMSMRWNCFAVARRFTCRAELLLILLKTPLPPRFISLWMWFQVNALGVLFVTTCQSWMVSLIYTGEVSNFTSWHGVLLSWWGLCAFFNPSFRMQCILKWADCFLCSLVFTVHCLVLHYCVVDSFVK